MGNGRGGRRRRKANPDRRADPSPTEGVPSRSDQLEYIADMLQQLKIMAARADCPTADRAAGTRPPRSSQASPWLGAFAVAVPAKPADARAARCARQGQARSGRSGLRGRQVRWHAPARRRRPGRDLGPRAAFRGRPPRHGATPVLPARGRPISGSSLMPAAAQAGGSRSIGAKASRMSSGSVTRVAPVLSRRLVPSARGSRGWPGTANTSRPCSAAIRAVISVPDRRAASTISTPSEMPEMIRLRRGKSWARGVKPGGFSLSRQPRSPMARCRSACSGG